jgi:hypothetical protein
MPGPAVVVDRGAFYPFPPQLPIRTDGPPWKVGCGSRCAAPACSPRQRGRSASRVSAKRLKRCSKAMSQASKSARVEPAPNPSNRRPATGQPCRLDSAGEPHRALQWRLDDGRATSMRSIAADATDTAIRGSGTNIPRPIASPVQMLENPAAVQWWSRSCSHAKPWRHRGRSTDRPARFPHQVGQCFARSPILRDQACNFFRISRPDLQKILPILHRQ